MRPDLKFEMSKANKGRLEAEQSAEEPQKSGKRGSSRS